MQEFLQIGKIVNTHGIKGEVKVIPLTDDPERFTKLKWIYVEKKDSKVKIEIESVKFFKGFVIIKFKGLNDMTAAEGYKDLFLVVDRKNAVKLPKDSFFICDIIDSEVFDESGIKLGELKDVLKTGSNDVYIVRSEGKKDILVPALKSVIKEISIEDKKIVVSLPEGIDENEV